MHALTMFPFPFPFPFAQQSDRKSGGMSFQWYLISMNAQNASWKQKILSQATNAVASKVSVYERWKEPWPSFTAVSSLARRMSMSL
jgi:hypothetical protein